jgi:hypothetical protein
MADALKPLAKPPKTASDLAAEAGIAMRQRWAREAEEDERAKAKAILDKANAEAKAKELRAKRGQFQFIDGMRDQILSGLTPSERARVVTAADDAGKLDDIEFLQVLVMKVEAERE